MVIVIINQATEISTEIPSHSTGGLVSCKFCLYGRHISSHSFLFFFDFHAYSTLRFSRIHLRFPLFTMQQIQPTKNYSSLRQHKTSLDCCHTAEMKVLDFLALRFHRKIFQNFFSVPLLPSDVRVRESKQPLPKNTKIFYFH